MIHRSIKAAAGRLGYTITRNSANADASLGDATFAGALARLKKRGVEFQSVIDVGAAVGSWSTSLAAEFPGKRHLLIEANAVHESALRDVCSRNQRWDYVLKACGPKCGSVRFDGTDPFGGQATLEAAEADGDLSEMTSIDHEAERLRLESPYLIKLDTHGFEVPILEGASRSLVNAEVLIIEAYNFRISNEAVRFWELCSLLERQGFVPIDMFDILYRPLDRSLWQMDIVFVRGSRPELHNHRYQ